MKTKIKLLLKSGKTIYEKGGKRWTLEDVDTLIKKGVSVKINRKNDNKNITNKILEDLKRKIWSLEEIKTLKEKYGTKTLPEIHKLFLPLKSVGQIRHKAASLNLTVDKKWQSHEVEVLEVLRKAGVSFPFIAKILQRPLHACQVKAHKVGLVYGGRANEELENTSDLYEKYEKLDTKLKGKIAEELATIRLVEEGFDVWEPYMPQHKTDLIVLHESKAVKIQVKSASWDRKTGRFRVPLHRKTKLGRAAYKMSDAHFFVIVCLGINAFYVAPFNETEISRYANLYPHRPRMIQKGFSWEKYRNAFPLLKSS